MRDKGIYSIRWGRIRSPHSHTPTSYSVHLVNPVNRRLPMCVKYAHRLHEIDELEVSIHTNASTLLILKIDEHSPKRLASHIVPSL